MGNNNELYPVVELPRIIRDFNAVHQAILLVLDTSGSMNHKDPVSGKTKSELMLECLKNMPRSIDISRDKKESIDLKILCFDDDVRTLVEWMPLSDFTEEFVNNITLDCAGQTSLSTAICTALDESREARRHYYENSIDCKATQVFLITDGESTEDMSQAFERAPYLDREHPSCKIHVVLVPPAKDPSDFLKLGKNTVIFKMSDMEKGFPAVFEFLAGSVVAWSESALGARVTTNVPEHLGVYMRDGQGGAKKMDDVIVIEDVDCVVDDEGFTFV